LVSIAHNNAQRLVRLINDILDIGKIESGQATFNLVPINIRTAIEQTIDANRAIADLNGCAVRLDTASQSFLVRADADRLVQILTNLLSNAIKFSPAGTEVVVMVERRGSTGIVTVRDHGPGISEEFKSRVFWKICAGRERRCATQRWFRTGAQYHRQDRGASRRYHRIC
jgi:signal transduction histidine kinase